MNDFWTKLNKNGGDTIIWSASQDFDSYMRKGIDDRLILKLENISGEGQQIATGFLTDKKWHWVGFTMDLDGRYISYFDGIKLNQAVMQIFYNRSS